MGSRACARGNPTQHSAAGVSAEDIVKRATEALRVKLAACRPGAETAPQARSGHERPAELSPRQEYAGRRLPSRAMLNYARPADMSADADARFRVKRGDRPGVIWIKRPAAETLRLELGPNEPYFFGDYLDLGRQRRRCGSAGWARWRDIAECRTRSSPYGMNCSTVSWPAWGSMATRSAKTHSWRGDSII